MQSYECAFCGDGVDDTNAEFRVLRVSAPEMRGFQEVFAHRQCLVAALRPTFPLGELLEPPA